LRKNYVLQVLEPFERNEGANAIVAGGERRSYASIRRTTPRLARILHNQGVRAGAGVAVLATGAIGSVALHLVGGRPGWMVTCAPVRGQAALATFTQRDVAICTVAERRERIAGELTGHGGLLKIFSAGAAGRENGSLRRAERGPGRVRRGTGGPDLESVCYTSGTTGKPKARPAWRGYYAALPASPSTT
jgi:acyl-coenzyme A synthetase/AMP-(fatty) acid ligase